MSTAPRVRRKVAIYLTPTGGRITKKDAPYVPLQPQEIADVVAECHGLGAAIAHIHARDPSGADTCDSKVYREINALIRRRCDIVVNNSAGGGTTGEMVEEYAPGQFKVLFSERMRTFDADAEVVVVDPFTKSYPRPNGSSVLFETTPSQSYEMIRVAAERGIIPEISVVSAEHYAERIVPMLKCGHVKKPYHLSISAGSSVGVDQYMPTVLGDLMAMTKSEDVFLRVGASGPFQWAALAHGILLGANSIRVGLEDAIHDDDGNPVSNQDLVRRAAKLIRDLGCEPASPSEARAMMGLKQA